MATFFKLYNKIVPDEKIKNKNNFELWESLISILGIYESRNLTRQEYTDLYNITMMEMDDKNRPMKNIATKIMLKIMVKNFPENIEIQKKLHEFNLGQKLEKLLRK